MNTIRIGGEDMSVEQIKIIKDSLNLLYTYTSHIFNEEKREKINYIINKIEE